MENSNRASQLALQALTLSKQKRMDSTMRIFEQTNENLTKLFQFYPVYHKDVLTVLASSDQLFSCYYYGANHIDCFDKSYVTLYYYYLRKWLILYQNHLYPSYHFFYDGDIDLYDLICHIQPCCSDEVEAQVFWKTYLEKHRHRSDKYLFHISSYSQPKPFDHNLSSIKGIFDKELHFSCINMFENQSFSKKYDVLVLSNLLEYADHENELVHARDNIESLLKDGGIAICTCMIYDGSSVDHLKEVSVLTSHDLQIEDVNCRYYEPLLGRKKDLAYSYRLQKK